MFGVTAGIVKGGVAVVVDEVQHLNKAENQ
jgi:uncharacterized protein (UPF0254 family)